MAMSTAEKVRHLNDRALHDLLEAHKQRRDQPLVLAVRYDLSDDEDVHLLEVLEDFPGGDEDELFVTEFEPSAQLRILGKLQLTLASPAQLESAARRGEVERFRSGSVAYEDGSARAESLKQLLGLR